MTAGHYATVTNGGLAQRRDFDFDFGITGQAGHLYRRTGRWVAGEVLAVDGIHGCEIAHVCQKYRDFDHFFE